MDNKAASPRKSDYGVVKGHSKVDNNSTNTTNGVSDYVQRNCDKTASELDLNIQTHAEEMQESSNSKYRCLHVCSVIGLVFLYIPNGIRWVWGNITAYTSSYFYVHGGHNLDNVDTPWMISIISIAWNVGLYLAGPMLNRFDRRVTLYVGLVVYDLGIGLSYLAMKYNSIGGLDVTFGVIIGLADGVLETIVILLASEWAGKYQGLILTIVRSSHLVGASVYNQVVTWYINPDNLTPDLKIGANNFFTQTSVINKTPSFFLVFTALVVLVHIIGLCLVHYYKTNTKSKLLSLCSQCWPELRKSMKGIDPNTETTDIISLNKKESSGASTVNETKSFNTPTEEEAIESGGSMTTQEALRDPLFYVLGFGLCCSELAKLWLTNYYKLFGLNHISDDHFLADIGTIMSIIAAAARVTWGFTADNLGNETTLLLCSASTSIITAFNFFSLQINRWVYAISTLVFACAVNGYSAVISVTVLRLYGKKHFAIIYGVISTPLLLVYIVLPFMFQGFLDRWGWFSTLISVSLVNTLAVFLQAVALIYRRNKASQA